MKLLRRISLINSVFFLAFALLVTLNSQLITIYARVSQEDIVNSQKENYAQKVAGYSAENKFKLESLSQKIVGINKKRTDELEQLTLTMGEVLDEYQARMGDEKRPAYEREQDAVGNARYWITFAHEAIAFQAGKIYIFNLTSEGNLKSDASSTINLFQSNLEYARAKTIYALNLLKGVVKNEK
ncbi:hypothetical protein A3D25_03460 [Candidatus Daviesbacteria bacterium RIFCSPHIGHO2_02_FULL_43_12]|uniref:Uncharacterized protein n=1 Tax=Candidatus Daviesbacteria bacterium RIFCSPHIGHO2_02_FULL_43_12 TaxID=1797776 RepID=A0A1F5KG24_9BACT|nr:MAG: hypothetical protein A3E86_03020 [Candidatus Daviesbacteria bacterium RIFCSPHIGHO2_12_FULL_47_45]OGE39760.1 MAG: hypothetical protein A3D25_03460 [Candidatus Daviesbacteria bacterium RIFCSPHIGHO2_02_FULL_43_12]OGE69949.1 MAG: hypothetical protein A3B55_04625 [Candidatus Daviesbacteria bacterium RIFCSPLOWO2_01_FULL_43_15]